MFDFGIGAYFKAIVNIYKFTSRNTGRTNLMLSQLKQGDTVVFLDRREADRVKKICKEKGFDIVVYVSDSRNFHEKSNQILTKVHGGNLYFDHCFIEDWYDNAINFAGAELQNFHTMFSNTYQKKPIVDNFQFD